MRLEQHGVFSNCINLRRNTDKFGIVMYICLVRTLQYYCHCPYFLYVICIEATIAHIICGMRCNARF